LPNQNGNVEADATARVEEARDHERRQPAKQRLGDWRVAPKSAVTGSAVKVALRRGMCALGRAIQEKQKLHKRFAASRYRRFQAMYPRRG
jgi:hypothetical protein